MRLVLDYCRSAATSAIVLIAISFRVSGWRSSVLDWAISSGFRCPAISFLRSSSVFVMRAAARLSLFSPLMPRREHDDIAFAYIMLFFRGAGRFTGILATAASGRDRAITHYALLRYARVDAMGRALTARCRRLSAVSRYDIIFRAQISRAAPLPSLQPFSRASASLHYLFHAPGRD